jgi:hypothetical protein
MDSNLAPYMTELAVSWGLNAAGILFVIPVILLRVTDREALRRAILLKRAVADLSPPRRHCRGCCQRRRRSESGRRVGRGERGWVGRREEGLDGLEQTCIIQLALGRLNESKPD